MRARAKPWSAPRVGGLYAGAIGPAGLVDLHEDLAGADHAEVVASAFLDRLAPLGEIAQFGLEAGVVGRHPGIGLLLLDELPAQAPDFAPASLAEPEWILDRDKQCAKDQGEGAHRWTA